MTPDKLMKLSSILETHGHRYVATLSEEIMSEMYPRFTNIAHQSATTVGHISIIDKNGFIITSSIEDALRCMELAESVDDIVRLYEIAIFRISELRVLLIREVQGIGAARSWNEELLIGLREKYIAHMLPAVRSTAEKIINKKT